MRLKGEYKGYPVFFDTDAVGPDPFFADVDGQRIHAMSWGSLKRQIDQIERENFNRIDVLILGWAYESPYKEGVVTSIIDATYECWVSFRTPDEIGPKRQKCKLSNAYLDTPDNRDIFRQIRAKDSEADKHRNEAEALRKTLTSLADIREEE